MTLEAKLLGPDFDKTLSFTENVDMWEKAVPDNGRRGEKVLDEDVKMGVRQKRIAP